MSLGFAEENASTPSEPQQPPPPSYLSPQTVIDGGQLPEGWTPKLIPYSGVGPDGKPITVMIAPTYVFTLSPAVPTVAPPVQPGPTATAAAVAQSAAKPAPPVVAAARQPPSVPYGSNWVYQTQGVAAVATSLAKSAPPAAPQVAAWGGSPLGQPAPPYGASPPLAAVAAAPPPPPPALVAEAPLQPPPQPQQYNAALQPPPTQWGSTVDSGAISTLAVAAPVAAVAASASPPPTTGNPMTASIGPPPPAMQESAAANAGVSPPTDRDPPLQSTPPPAPPASAGYRWRVVGVVDGDLMTCLDETGGQQKVRLAEIDAPELGQDYGTAAREALADYVFGKTVQVVDHGKDRSGRWIARVYVDGLDVNRELVGQGAAWHYAAASSDPSLTDLQNQARSRKLGLWAQPDPVPPWQWRALQ